MKLDRSTSSLLSLSAMYFAWGASLLLIAAEPDAPLVGLRPQLLAPLGSTFRLTACGTALLLDICGAGLLVALSESFSKSKSLARWLSLARYFVAAIPLAGIFVLPVWHWIVFRRPIWARVEPDREGAEPWEMARPLGLSPQWVARHRGVCSLGAFAAHTLAGYFGLVGYLAQIGPGALLTDSLQLFRIGLRIMAFVSTLIVIISAIRNVRISGRRSAVIVGLSLGWLAPGPLPVVVGFFAVVFAEPLRERGLLLQLAYAGRRGAEGAVPEWLPATGWQAWRLEESRVLVSRARYERLFRAKTVLLVLDATGLVLLLVRWSAPYPEVVRCFQWLQSQASNLLWSLQPSCLIPVLAVLNLAERWPQLLPGFTRTWKYWISTPGALILGTAQGLFLWKHDVLTLALLLLWSGWSAALSVFSLALLPAYYREPKEVRLKTTMPWLALFLGIALLGNCILIGDPQAALIVWLLTTVVLLTPLWAIILFFLVRHDLLRQPAFPSGEPRGRRIALVLTALLPLGGLAVPVWRFLDAEL